MFLLNEILLFTPLIVYVYFRIRALIPKGAGRIAWACAFILLIAGFPIAETLSHRGSEGWARSLMIACDYALPLLLYLVLVVAPFDILIGAARLLRILSRENVRGPCFRRARLSAYLVLPVVIVLFGIWNFNHLRIKAYSIEVPRKSSALTELKIAFAADFHLGDRTSAGFMEAFVAKVNALEPDIVLIGGDVLEGDRREKDLARYESQFRRLRSKYGVFGVPGNHERYAGGRDDFFNKAGIRLLRDETVTIDGAFILAGRNDARSRNRTPLAELLKGNPDDLPVILLDHRPTDLENAARSGVAVQLSGHTHHGQLFPVNFITAHRYELSWGYKKKNQTHVFVTSGVQLWGPPVRTAGASEILSIRVAFREPSSSAPPPASPGRARGCTAFVMKSREAVLLAKNFDGPVGDGYIFINKRDVDKEAFESADSAPLRWRSKHGSVTFNQFGREFPLGGLNEAGLVVEELSGPAEYPPADARPAINELQWIQYQLDNSSSVKGVLKSDAALRISKLLFNLHYLVADRKGNVAVVEFVQGKMAAVTGGQLPVPVLSNGAYAESVRSLGFHAGFGGDRAVSNGPDSGVRFVRAAAILKEYESLGTIPFVDDAFVALRSLGQDDTQWSIAYNIPRRLVFFKTKAHRRYKIIGLDRFDLSGKTPALMLPVGTDASWDLSGQFVPFDPDQNRLLIEGVFKKIEELEAAPPKELAKKMAALGSRDHSKPKDELRPAVADDFDRSFELLDQVAHDLEAESFRVF